jgi:glutamyl/glutaminyl-tRNA synthetase
MKTRFAPSPTGYIHMGNARTALFSYLAAQADDGQFVLRIEDTDAERSKEEYVSALKEDLLWLGLPWQEGPDHDGGNGPYWQSQRNEIYAIYYNKLIDMGLVYPCFCSSVELEVMRKMFTKMATNCEYLIKDTENDGTVTVTQSTDAPTGFQNSLRMTVTAADTSMSANQYGGINGRLEGLNIADMVDDTFTLSFWVRSSKTGNSNEGSLKNSSAGSIIHSTQNI